MLRDSASTRPERDSALQTKKRGRPPSEKEYAIGKRLMRGQNVSCDFRGGNVP